MNTKMYLQRYDINKYFCFNSSFIYFCIHSTMYLLAKSFFLINFMYYYFLLFFSISLLSY